MFSYFRQLGCVLKLSFLNFPLIFDKFNVLEAMTLTGARCSYLNVDMVSVPGCPVEKGPLFTVKSVMRTCTCRFPCDTGDTDCLTGSVTLSSHELLF